MNRHVDVVWNAIYREFRIGRRVFHKGLSLKFNSGFLRIDLRGVSSGRRLAIGRANLDVNVGWPEDASPKCMFPRHDSVAKTELIF